MVFVKPAPGLESVLCPWGAEITLFEMESANLRRSAIKAHVFECVYKPLHRLLNLLMCRSQ